MELSKDQQKNFDAVKNEIAERIIPEVFATLDEFHKHRLLPGESSLFVYELNKLLDQAIPSIDATACEQLLFNQFLGGLPASVRSEQPQARQKHSTKLLNVHACY